MDSPITADQREGCIAELKRDNDSNSSGFRNGIISAVLLIGVWVLFKGSVLIDPFEAPDWAGYVFALIFAALIVTGACFALCTWAVMQWIAETTKHSAAEVFSQTGIVNYVLSLPSDVQAYGGRLRAAAYGEWLTFRQEQFDARRRAKAIVERFGTW